MRLMKEKERILTHERTQLQDLGPILSLSVGLGSYETYLSRIWIPIEFSSYAAEGEYWEKEGKWNSMNKGLIFFILWANKAPLEEQRSLIRNLWPVIWTLIFGLLYPLNFFFLTFSWSGGSKNDRRDWINEQGSKNDRGVQKRKIRLWWSKNGENKGRKQRLRKVMK